MTTSRNARIIRINLGGRIAELDTLVNVRSVLSVYARYCLDDISCIGPSAGLILSKTIMIKQARSKLSRFQTPGAIRLEADWPTGGDMASNVAGAAGAFRE